MTNNPLAISACDSIQKDTLLSVLRTMLGTSITDADCHSKELHGGTVGKVFLITGTANTANGKPLPYEVVLKVQKKWDRHGDSDSWRREYDLYLSGFEDLFHDSLRWPVCYHAEMNEDENETLIWMEYIDSVSGYDLTVDMFERAAYALGRFQGKLHTERPAILHKLTNLSKAEDLKDYYLHFRSWKKLHDYIRSDDCGIPRHLCDMLIDVDEKADEIWNRIEKLPIVLCHRDFWVTNIFYRDGTIILIDWDTCGWGYMGEDIKSLIADEADVLHMAEYYRRCVPAYYKGFSEYADVSNIEDNCIREMILVNIGYRLAEWHMNADSEAEKLKQIETLQRIYEMKDIG